MDQMHQVRTDERALVVEAGNAEAFMQALQAAYMDQATMDRFMLWHEAYERWLKRYGSPSTQRAYRESWADFFRFTKRYPWAVLSSDAIAWQGHLQERGLAPASVNRYVAALSSFYSFVRRDLRRQDDDTERSIFVDASGRLCDNPFRAAAMERIKKPKSQVYPLSREELRAIYETINTETRTGARDMALYQCYLRTGRRLKEIIRLRWCDIEPTRKGGYKFWWIGKGADRDPENKTGWRVMPQIAYDAIVAYLKRDGRWPVVDPDMYVFQPLSDHGVDSLPHMKGKELPQNRHISGGHVNAIAKKWARRAGIDESKVHIHVLRHSFAFHLYEETKDYKLIKDLLDHEDLKTTIGYVDGMQEPDDEHSAALQMALGF